MTQSTFTPWYEGKLLAFSGLDGQTNYAQSIVLRTEADMTISVRRPASATISMTLQNLDSANVTADFKGDVVAINANGEALLIVFFDAFNVILDGAFALNDPNDAYEFHTQGNRSVLAVKGFFNPEAFNVDVRELVEKRLAFIRDMAAKLPANLPEDIRQASIAALAQAKTQIYAPEAFIKSRWSTPDRYPHAKMWIWDSVFHAIGIRHFDIQLARELISAVFDAQREDGFIPHMMGPDGFSNHTQPPVLGLGIEKLQEIEPDDAWARDLALKLERFLLWIMDNRDTDKAGLVEWYISDEAHCRSGESGMDNSPRFDGAIQLDATDFNSYLAHECEVLAKLLPEKADFWMEHHRRICKLMNQRLWAEALNFYVDYDVIAGERLDMMASSGLLPLYCGAPDERQASLLKDHVNNPETFGTPFRIPSISASQAQYYLKDMWRGPVWLNVNYMIALGLERYGFADDARKLLKETVDEETRHFNSYGTFFEFYDDKATDDPPQLIRKSSVNKPGTLWGQPLRDYGWSATLYLDFVMTLYK